jgi:exonuclease I
MDKQLLNAWLGAINFLGAPKLFQPLIYITEIWKSVVGAPSFTLPLSWHDSEQYNRAR